MSRSPSSRWPLYYLGILLLLFFVYPGINLPAPSFSFDQPRPGGILRIKAYGRTLNMDLDPAGNGYPEVIENLYEGLLRLDRNLSLFPGLADYWTISEGGQKVIFYLRKGAVFHNGQPVTAEDVKFSYERLFQLKGNPLFYLFASRIEGGEEFWQGAASEVLGLKVLDSQTLEIDWKSPNINNFYFLAASFAKILPRNLILKEKRRFFEKPIGAGPFKFDFWLRNSRLDIIGISLARNEKYFGRKPYLQTIEISPYFLLDDFFRDEVQVVPYLSYRISKNKYQVIENSSNHLAYLFFNCHQPPFDRPEIRKALAGFIDKSRLAGLVSSPAYFAQVLNNFIPPFLPGFLPIQREEEADLSRIYNTLSEAGLGNPAKPLTVYLYFEFPLKELVQNIYQELREDLRPASINLELRPIKSLSEIKNEQTPYLVYFDWLVNLPDPEFLISPLFYSRSYFNSLYFHYQNQQVDELLETQSNLSGFDRRLSIFRQIETLLKADLPAIPLYYFNQRMAYQPYIKNLKAQPLGFFYLNLRDAWIDR
ncbi:MAG: hypothetical protein C0168_04995 [Candidatus Aminicenantes bacterium]|nr:MAG: hypothetical protein C0168_04995 [Candidatus Aminicenantes bacterium]